MDKCAIAALSATFKEYMDEARAVKNIPVLQMIARPLSELKKQAETLLEQLDTCSPWADFTVEESTSMVGGGSLPGEELASFALTILPKEMSCEAVTEAMRKHETPIIAHIKEEKVWVDMRTVQAEEIAAIAAFLTSL